MSSSPKNDSSQSSAPIEGVEYWQRLVRQQQEISQTQLQTIEKLEGQLKRQQERIEQLETELRTRKKLKGKPKVSPSQLNKGFKPEPSEGKRAGSDKRSKKENFEVDEEQIVEPKTIPDGAEFNGYRVYDVQEIEIRRHNIRFQLAEYVKLDGTTVVGELPQGYGSGHFGPKLVSYILYQHYQCRVPQPLLYEQLREWGIDISVGQVNRLLTEHQAPFVQEQQQVLQVGLETAEYIHTDDTGARHQGKNGYCTVIGNEWFTYFQSSESKSRRNFLAVLQGGQLSYVLNESARQYLESQPLALKHWGHLSFGDECLAVEQSEWQCYLLAHGVENARAVQVISEAALLGGVMSQGMNVGLRILSDGAGQFNILCHGLCWVHAERGLRRLQGTNPRQCRNIEKMQERLWQYYRQLQQYQQHPSAALKAELWGQFDQIFRRHYRHHPSLNTVLTQFRAHKAELLQVLDYPGLPLHNNAAETDIREYVTRRKISGGTRSDAGRQARDTFVGLKKTCRKLGVSFWQYLLSRLRGDGNVPLLSEVIRTKATAKLQGAVAT
jgi:Transposase IS66 family